MAFETADVHESNSHAELYAAAAAAVSLALLGATWYLTKGRAAEAIPELKLGLGGEAACSSRIQRLAQLVHVPYVVKEAPMLFDESPVMHSFVNGSLKTSLIDLGGSNIERMNEMSAVPPELRNAPIVIELDLPSADGTATRVYKTLHEDLTPPYYHYP